MKGVGMNLSTELRFAPAVAGMTAILDPYQPWLESVRGGPLSETITFEIDMTGRSPAARPRRRSVWSMSGG
jgi:hypothetical protein